MKKTLLFTFILFFLFSLGQNQNLDWKLTTPFLRTEAIKKIEIISDQCFLAHKDNAKDDLIITEDNGKTWRQINDFSLSVRDFTIKNNKGYALIGPELRVTDQKFSTPGTTYILPVALTNSIFVLNDNTIFIGTTNSKMLKTTDGGSTWSTYNIPTVYSDRISGIFFTTADTGFCVTASSSGNSYICKTSNGGQTWSIVNTATESFSKIIFKNTLNGIALSPNGITKYTLDGGNTWSDATGVNYLDDIQLYNNEYLAVGSPNKFYKTTSGESWVNSIIYPAAFNVYKSLAIHSDFILAGSNNESGSSELRHTILKTADLINWNPMNIKWIEEELYKSVYASDKLAIVPYRFFSKDRGYTWQRPVNTFPSGPISILPNGKGIGLSTAGNQYWKTNDNGVTWAAEVSPNFRLAIPAMKPNGDFAIAHLGTNANAYTGYVATYSANGWTPPVSVEWEVSSMKFVDNNLGFLVNRTNVKKTTDGGLTWNNVSYPGSINDARNIVLGNSSRIYIGKYYTADSGNTWTSVSGQMLSFNDYDIFENGTGYGMDSNRDVWKTTNFGNSWQKIVSTALLITPGSTIQKTAFAKDYMVAVGLSGFYVLDFVTAALSTNDPLLVTENKARIYPNPTSSILYFDVKDPIKNITVFDLSGKIFRNLNFPKLNSIDISDLSSGNYFIRITSGNKTYLEKIIKK